MALIDAPPEQPANQPPPPPQGQPSTPSWQKALRLGGLVLLVAYIGVRGGLSWLAIIGAIVVMIFLHELGHYLTAKWAGMKVTQFFLGFGPRIWSFQRGETEYGIKAIPAGAYVKVIGMYNVDDVDPADEARTYRQAKFHQRVIMAAAGSTMHFLLALGLIYAVLAGIGRQEIDNWQVDEVSAGSAAEAVGLLPGDRLVSIDGESVRSWDDMADVVQPRRGETVPVVLERDGRTTELTVTIGTNPDDPSRGQLGVSPDFPYERVNALAAVPETGREFGSLIWASTTGLVRMFTPSGLGSFAEQVAEGGPEEGQTGGATISEDDTRFISIYGAARLGVDLFGEGAAPALGFLAMLNIFIGLFNLVPLLPFDGGHIAIAVYERIQEARKRDGRRHFTDVARLMPLTYAVVLLLVAIGVSSIYLDVVNPINLP
ncbi:MAG: RIP metalloprotease [Acidimicrobiia bacterium]